MGGPPLADYVDGVKTLGFGDFAWRVRVGVAGEYESATGLVHFLRAVPWCNQCQSIT